MTSWKMKRVSLYLGHLEAFRMAHRVACPIVLYKSRDGFMFDALA